MPNDVTLPTRDMVATVVEWLDDPNFQRQLRAGRDWLVTRLQELIQCNRISCEELIDSADAGDLLAHQALMAEYDRWMDSHTMPPVMLVDYARRSRRHGGATRKRGSHTEWDNVIRDVGITQMAIKIRHEFGIDLTRSEATDRNRPCAAGVLAEALKRSREWKRSGYRVLREKRIANILTTQRKSLESLITGGLNLSPNSRG
jgi:hypothetical protein